MLKFVVSTWVGDQILYEEGMWSLPQFNAHF